MKLPGKKTTEPADDRVDGGVDENGFANPVDPANPAPKKGQKGKKETPAVTVPGVNLLSEWVFEEMRVATLRRRVILGVIALLVLVAAGWGVQTFRLMSERSDLREAQSEQRAVQTEIDDLLPVSDYVTNVYARADLIAQTMYTQVEFSKVFDQLSQTTRGSVQIASAAITIPPPGTEPIGDPTGPSRGLAAVCPGPNPFATPEIIGCVQISGSAPDRETVGRFADALEDSEVFVESYFGSTTTGVGEPVTFTGSVGLSPNAFAGTYDDLVAQIDAASAAAASPEDTTSVENEETD